MNDSFCFAAGTLVHTKDGLAPIEVVGVGDWVLTQPEDKGERTYKRVTRTVKHEDKPVILVGYASLEALDLARTENRFIDEAESKRLVVTPNHPFWVSGFHQHYFPDWDGESGVGWTRADKLLSGTLIELADGTLARVTLVKEICRTTNEGVGWIGGTDSPWGHLVDLRDGKIRYDYKTEVKTEFANDEMFYLRIENESDEWAYKCDVYNFEVEDCHTYFVDDLGVWVHNTNCFE